MSRGRRAEVSDRRPALLLCLLAGTAMLACGRGGDEGRAAAGADHLEAARSFVQEGRYDSALARYDLALEGGAPTVEVLADVAVVHLRQGRWERALAELDSLARVRPEDPKVYYDRSRAHEGMGRPGRALEDLDRALALDSGLADAYLTRGALYAERDDLRLAIADFEEAASLSGSEAAYRNLGIARLEAGEPRRALEIFDELLARAPLRARYHLYRGRAHRELGREGAAEADFRRTLELTGNPGLREQAIRALREMDADRREPAPRPR